MRFIIALSVLLSSFSSFANCKISITKPYYSHATDKHLEIIRKKLGDTFTDVEGDADFNFEVIFGSGSVGGSWWTGKVNYSDARDTEHRYFVKSADTRNFDIPVFFLTLGVSAMIPTSGNIVAKKLAEKLPTCNELREKFPEAQ